MIKTRRKPARTWRAAPRRRSRRLPPLTRHCRSPHYRQAATQLPQRSGQHVVRMKLSSPRPCRLDRSLPRPGIHSTHGVMTVSLRRIRLSHSTRTTLTGPRMRLLRFDPKAMNFQLQSSWPMQSKKCETSGRSCARGIVKCEIWRTDWLLRIESFYSWMPSCKRNRRQRGQESELLQRRSLQTSLRSMCKRFEEILKP